MTQRRPERVVVEADGGSRGNPGPAAYGALVRDAVTGDVLAEEGTTIGRATNNVAEYSGLVAGLRLAVEVAPGASVEVRMDSKLVVEQMRGAWRVKHPDMKPLHAEASAVAPAGTTYTWVPRAENAHADRLANEALDGVRDGVTYAAAAEEAPSAAPSPIQPSAPAQPSMQSATAAPARGWAAPSGPPTTLVLVRHGVTRHTAAKKFSGGLGGDNPPLSVEGLAQVRATADWLAPLAERVGALVTSPVRRTVETAQVLGDRLGHVAATEHAFAEMEFGEWEGLTFPEVLERDPDALTRWIADPTVAPPGGESFGSVRDRVHDGLRRVVAEHAGSTVVVASHVTPIKTLVATALGVDIAVVHRMELAPASVTVVSFYPDDRVEDGPLPGHRGSMRLFNARPPGDGGAFEAAHW
ncbi:bifunctional RNase H/acid phosphatase [Nocardioides sp. GY 10127]|uniref:bifunctional RNase H/acid phosphatase n=1 Tax=Nocardioides sp. GY 10127 TaxID=2569762 RepID=UPI0010A9446A|nr:bifunctional RNase H/acid phosphatase [Nocardioides sp. GY 10127]TIC85704.1 bifunctional RNase H/acid phosphatase [Nocardioides sp. GY 10127]